MKIRTDAEYVKALRALWQYAEVKATIARAEGEKTSVWSIDMRQIAEMYETLSQPYGTGDGVYLVDAAAVAEIQRGGVDLIGMNEAEQREAAAAQAAAGQQMLGDVEVCYSRFDQADPFERKLLAWWKANWTCIATRSRMMEECGYGAAKAIIRLREKGALRQRRYGRKIYFELAI